MPKMRMTLTTRLILRALLSADSDLYGWEIARACELKSGTVHPILARLEALGFAESAWEDEVAARAAGRRTRRYYRLTATGTDLARANPMPAGPLYAAPSG